MLSLSMMEEKLRAGVIIRTTKPARAVDQAIPCAHLFENLAEIMAPRLL